LGVSVKRKKRDEKKKKGQTTKKGLGRGEKKKDSISEDKERQKK